MIVDPDFLDHWRTRMMVDALDGDEMAPLCILRLWAHCQSRKSDRFEMPTAGLKAQCRYKGDAQQFEQALIDAGFIERDGREIHVLGWAAQNASLIAAWENGSKGGRPKTKPAENQEETHGKPSGNPASTQTEPIREDKSREEKPKNKKAPPAALPVSVLVDMGVPEQVVTDWYAIRAKKRLPLTQTALDELLPDVQKAGMTLEAAIRLCCKRGWAGFESAWLDKPQARASPPARNDRSGAAAAIFGTDEQERGIIDVN